MAHSSMMSPNLKISKDRSASRLTGWLMELFMKFFWVMFI